MVIAMKDYTKYVLMFTLMSFFLTAILCPDLEHITNGQVRLTGNTVGSGAIYTCSPGYTLEGFQQRRCKDDGVWEGTPPTCHLTKTCKYFLDYQYNWTGPKKASLIYMQNLT